MGADVVNPNCRGCGAPLSSIVFEMDPMPLAGAFASSRADACASEKLPLAWLQCGKCELVQVKEDVPDRMLYQRYCYASSTVPGLVRHFASYARFLGERFAGGARRVLEIGCNDGVLLTQLPASWEKVGVDPSDIAMRAQVGSAYDLINEPFGTHLGLRGYDLVVASNCLAHITQIEDAIEAAAQALVPGGEFWVEVHDLDATLQTGQWDTIYHEHKAEYSIRSLCRVVMPHGFSLIAVERLPLHGGLLRVGFTRGGCGTRVDAPRPSFGLLRETYRLRRQTEVYSKLRSAASQRRPILAYGASGRATVWFNQLPELEFAAVVDDSSARAGKYVPGVGWPIVPWDERPPTETCVITAWNYADDIRRKREYSGQWLQTWGT